MCVCVCVSQSSDRTACIWDSRSGQCVMRFEGHAGEVNSVKFFPTGEAVGTACNDGTVSEREILITTRTA